MQQAYQTTLVHIDDRTTLCRIGQRGFALVDTATGLPITDTYACPLLAYVGKQFSTTTYSAKDGNGNPSEVYQKPLSYHPSVFTVRACKTGVYASCFNRKKTPETSQDGIALVAEYNRTRRGRRALRCIQHAIRKAQDAMRDE